MAMWLYLLQCLFAMATLTMVGELLGQVIRDQRASRR